MTTIKIARFRTMFDREGECPACGVVPHNGGDTCPKCRRICSKVVQEFVNYLIAKGEDPKEESEFFVLEEYRDGKYMGLLLPSQVDFDQYPEYEFAPRKRGYALLKLKAAP
jgi:hypothetical protein